MRYPKTLRWPVKVWVLTSENLSGQPGCDLNNNPQSPILWMNAEIRNLPMPAADLFLLCDIWVDRFVKISTQLKHRRIKHDLCDVYNAAWASLGYTENQCPKALRFAELYKKPFLPGNNNGILDYRRNRNHLL